LIGQTVSDLELPDPPKPSLAKMESCHWLGTLKNKKQPFAAQNPYFRLGVRNAAFAAIQAWPAIGASPALSRRSAAAPN